MSTLGTSDPAIPNEKNFAYVESRKIYMLVDHEKNALCDGYIVEFIHDYTENYYEGGIYACRSCNNIKFPPYVLKVLKLYLFCLPMLVDSCSHKLCAHKIPRHTTKKRHIRDILGRTNFFSVIHMTLLWWLLWWHVCYKE